MTGFFESYRQGLAEALASLDLAQVEQAANIMREARANDKTIWVCGNGGSYSSASHFVCDVVKGAGLGREPKDRFKMICIGDNTPTMTAYSNDVAYEEALVEQLKNFARPGDVCLAISGSGNSPNVVKALAYAREIGCKTISMTGRGGGKLKDFADCNILAKEQHMGRIEDVHMIACHMLAYYFMEGEKKA